MNTVATTQAPKEGEIVNVMTSKPPELNSQIEFIKGKRAVAIGIVIESNSHTYKTLVIMSEAGPQ